MAILEHAGDPYAPLALSSTKLRKAELSIISQRLQDSGE